MTLSQASTSAQLKLRASAKRPMLQRDGNDDLWAKLDAKLAEQEHRKTLAKQVSQQANHGGWFRHIARGMGFGLR